MTDEGQKQEINMEKLGHIPFSMHGHGQSNCLAIQFESAHAMNNWFESNRGCNLLYLQPHGNGTLAIVSRVMSKEEWQEYQDIQVEVSAAIAKRREARQMAEMELEVKKQEAEREARELQVVGRRCREHHGAVIEENTKLKKELKKLRKGG